MNPKRLILALGAVCAIGLLAAFTARSVPATPAVDPHTTLNLPNAAGVSPFDLQCTAKFPGGFAQCGSQASSCKSCHEVAGEDPINDKGDWHTQHAFGDFCEFCHSGNVQSPDKAEAHTGMVEPLGDLKVNCAMCHAADYDAKAEVYAKTLGITLGAAVAAPTKAPADAPAADATPAPADVQPAPAEAAKQPEAPAVNPETFTATPVSAEVIDYVAQYKSAALPVSTSNGNLLFVAGLVVLGLTIVGGSGVVMWSQKRPQPKAKPATDARSQALAQLMPMLDKLDAAGLHDVAEFVSQREKPQA